MNDLAGIGAALLGGALNHAEVLHGGGLSQVMQIALDDGRTAIVKGGPAPRTEAVMLNAIAKSGAPAPTVLAVSEKALVMEVVPTEGGPAGAWESLGAALAGLHAVTGEQYGWAKDYAFGAMPIENGWSDDWTIFWAERRLLSHLSQIPTKMGRRVEILAADLAGRLPSAPRPALLHGDLWGGNILTAGDRVTGLIDPACYFGHVEVDFAMLSLFDRPPHKFYAAYGPMEAGYDERLPIYQLWPALVHLRLFGGGYVPMVEGLLARAGV